MEANGNVVVVSPDGRRLETETLKYDNATNTISTNMHFTFDRGSEHLEGNSFRSDPGLQERRDRQAARHGGQRDAAARPGASRSEAARRAGACAGCSTSAGPARRAGAGSRRPRSAPPKPAPGRRPHRCPPPAVHLPDRQRRPPGRGERDAERHELLRRRQRPAELPGHPDHHVRATASRPTAATSSSSSAT